LITILKSIIGKQGLKGDNVNKVKDIAVRLTAVFVSSVLGTIGAASLLGQEAAIGAGIAGVLAVGKVGKDLADAMIDGKLTNDEIDSAFDKASPKKGK
jgi:hypothetical protein